MGKRIRRVSSIKRELVQKSREAALTAIRTYNDPHVTFKSETFIVLMIIAWTYLLHAYYRSKGTEYRYFKKRGNRRVFDKTKHGAYKFWELEKCLDQEDCPIDKNAINNLKFLIGLRHEIEHQMTLAIDTFVSGRFQACAINYNDNLKELFGDEYGLDAQIAFTIQFLQLEVGQVDKVKESSIPKKLRLFVQEFDSVLSHDEYNSPKYSYRLLFKKKLVNRPGQADRVVEFIDPNSDLAKKIDREYWVKKEVERPKYRATDVVAEVQKSGYPKFRVNPEHVSMWKSEDAKEPSKGFGTEVQGSWYWYRSWIDQCIKLCEAAGDLYK